MCLLTFCLSTLKMMARISHPTFGPEKVSGIFLCHRLHRIHSLPLHVAGLSSRIYYVKSTSFSSWNEKVKFDMTYRLWKLEGQFLFTPLYMLQSGWFHPQFSIICASVRNSPSISKSLASSSSRISSSSSRNVSCR